ncbi:hypothetical protein [Kordia sp.]|uniref:hypothetical protein n=1 Tax=Kordia sp. TaxID=1965332 RepID=UPI003B5A3C52
MKKKTLKLLRLTKKSISNLSPQKGGGVKLKRSDHGGATCLVCPSFATVCPECPSGEIMCQNQ